MIKAFFKHLAQSVLGFCYLCSYFADDKIKKQFEAIASIFYYASSLSFYTILSFSPILIFVALFLITPFAKSFELETLLFPNSPDFIQASRSFLHSFMQNNRTLGVVQIASITLAFLLFCENYRDIASKIFHAEPRDYFYFRGRRIFVFWGFGTGIVFLIVLPLIILYEIKVQAITNNPVLLSFLRWVGTYVFCLFSFLMPTNKVFKRLLYPLLWSLITSICWHLMKWGFVYYILYNRTYRELYGSVSILWFLMSYIYASWLLLLLGMHGCEVCDQNGTKKPLS
ncbi:Putative ribonuclease N [Helicobacter bizzozeronii]|nr:Putative ribonuclease N [Helicobacter bizzozeronii]